MHQIKGEEQQLEERHISDPIIARDLAQWVVVEQFSDILLDVGSLDIKAPQAVRLQAQVGDACLVGIAPIFQERQLGGLVRIVGKRTADRHKASRLFPAFALIFKLGGTDPVGISLETEAQYLATQCGVHFSHNHVAAAASFEVADEFVSKKAG